MNEEITHRDVRPPAVASPSLNVHSTDAHPSATSQSNASGMTYASKLPPDHPGLQLEKPRARTLRKGPVIASAVILAGTVGIALLVALSPRRDQPKAPIPVLPDSPSKNVTIAEAVQNAPGDEVDGHRGPRIGSLRRAAERQEPAGAGALPSPDPLRQAAQEEIAKALAAPILVDVENPVQADRAAAAPAATATSLTSAESAAAVAPGGQAASAADPNLQQHKSDFLNRDGANNGTYLGEPLLLPRSPYEVKAGTIIPTTLISGINSDLPGQIVGQVRESVYDTVTGNYLLIPQGSRLIATYDSAVRFGQERVLVCWNRLIRPDGFSIALDCMPGVDLAGYAGFSDEVDHHWWRIITGVALGTLLSATAQRSQGDVSGYTPTMPQLWASNAGSSLNQAGQAITQKNLAIQPTVKVRPGYTVNVFVSKDIVLVPYAQEGVTP